MLLSNCFVLLGLAPTAWAGVSEDVVAAGRFCGAVNSLVSRLGSAPASSAHAFCNNYLAIKASSTVTVSASAVTTTTVSTCPGVGASTSSTLSLAKRAVTPSRFVRTPGPLCPSFLTAIGTAALSTACSCLTSVTTTTTIITPTSTVTKYQQSTSTFTSTVTVQANPIITYSTATRLTTTITTSLSSVTSTITNIVDSTSTSVVTPTSTSTVYMGDTVTVTRSVTPTSSVQNLGKRTAPVSAAPPASSAPVDKCAVVITTVFTTVTSTSTTTSATTTTSTSTLVTGSIVAIPTTSSTTRIVGTVTSTLSPMTVVVTMQPTHTALNYIRNGDAEDPSPLSSTWQIDGGGTIKTVAGAGVNGSTAFEFMTDGTLYSHVQLTQQVKNLPNGQYLTFAYAGLQQGCDLVFYYVPNSGPAITRNARSISQAYVTAGPFRYDEPSGANHVAFYYRCNGNIQAPIRVDNVFLGSL
ncbi:hypothetical protein PYCC9005_004133 [Savitreella phatthalungensis]